MGPLSFLQTTRWVRTYKISLKKFASHNHLARYPISLSVSLSLSLSYPKGYVSVVDHSTCWGINARGQVLTQALVISHSLESHSLDFSSFNVVPLALISCH